jgi:CCR4-NOT transcription complex subunit 1
MNLIPGTDTEPGFAVVNYLTEIEAEVDAIYKEVYDEQTTIDRVIALLQRSKASSDLRDHEIFSCMLHFLFDEYKFFQSYYFARELATTGCLFGSIVQHELVDLIPLGIALRYVVDALSCPPETNLFKFGLQALARFESRLAEWQPLCQALSGIPHLMEARPDLAATIHRAIATGVDGSNGDMMLAVDPTPVFTAIQSDNLDAEIVKPAEELSDKVLFIVNNLAPSNFDAKLTEMKDHFDDAYARWFANYLVDQRISTEPNNHQLYLHFLDALEKPNLGKLILQETFTKSAAMLNNEKNDAGHV